MLNNTKYLLPILGIFLLTVLATGCMKDEVVEPCTEQEAPFYRNGGGEGEEGNGGGGISDGGDEESDSERNNKRPAPGS